MAETETKGFEIREGGTKISVPYGDSTRTFGYPAVGPNTYFEARQLLEEQGLQMPFASETIALVREAQQNPEGKYEREILDSLTKTWLWMNHVILYTPKKAENHGAYVVDSPKISNGTISLKERELLERLEQDDPHVRFVPFGYRTGTQTPKEFEKNPFIRALFGDEAELVGEVAANYRDKPSLWSVRDVRKKETRLSYLYASCLYALWGHQGLDIGVDADLGSESGYAFGVDL